MERSEFFTYSWHIDEKETNQTVIRIYGLNSENKSVCVIVNNFFPYAYVELPSDIVWTASKAKLVTDRLNTMLRDKKPVTYELVFKKRLYYANPDSKKLYPYIRCCCSHSDDIRQLSYKVKNPINILGIGQIVLKLHEHNANPILQLTSLQKLPTAGWIRFAGKRVPKDEQVTYCEYEYTVQWKNMIEKKTNTVARPLIMGYDIEVNSSIPSSMPKSERPQDKIFQISCVLGRQGSKPETYERYLLTLGEADEKSMNEEKIIVRSFDTEHDLLVGFTNLVQEKQPNILVGYNIFGFDCEYMIDRAKFQLCSDYSKQGMNKYGHAKEKTIEWSSSAYKNQSFKFLDAEGRIFVDLLPLVKRDYKMSNYQLKTIASHFLKDMTKDPLDAKGIFKCYRIGMEGGERGKKALALVGKYCVKDSELVVRLFETLTTWFALCEMSKVTNVPIFQLYTQGQQLKVFSQAYKKCTHENIVVERDGYITKEDDHYVGATVFPPVAGVYENVIPFDFCLSGDTLISMNNGCSKRIDSLIKNEKVLGFKSEQGLSSYSTVNGLQIKGEKDVVKIWFEDGSSIVSTPEHNFMLDSGDWCEGKDLKDKYIKCGLEFAEDVVGSDENDWSMTLGDCSFDMKENRDKTLAFTRILGYVLTDGSIYISNNRKCVEVYLGTNIDALNLKEDIKQFSDVDVSIRKRGMDKIKGVTYSITLPSYLSNLIHKVDGIVVGKRATQPMALPRFLLDKMCPLAIVREFLGGLFGGDGTSPYHTKGRVGNISFKWTTIEKHLSALESVFIELRLLLERFGLKATLNTPIKIKYGANSIKPKDYLENPRWDLQLNISDIIRFSQKIGFRYCVNKSCRLTVATSYLRLCEKTREQNKKVFQRTSDLFDSGGISISQALEIARNKCFNLEPPVNINSISSIKDIGYQRHEKKRHFDKPRVISLRYKKDFPTFTDYLKSTNTEDWFVSKYAVKSDDLYIPVFKKRVIDVREEKATNVYDIEVQDVHNFIANGVVAHNCSLYPTTIIAYNISWDTLVKEDDKIPDSDCHVMDWTDHISCSHDPKEIRKAELNKLIKESDEKIKEIRKERDLKKNKNNKEEFNEKIDTIKKETKPLREERSQLQKSKAKHVICAKRRYRWLKSPMGVLPEILTHLLETRSATKKEMKSIKAKLKEMKEGTDEYTELATYHDVLDQRQLALKVSANSGYGCMGVRRGYLPFMPGAMATTYMGRKAIEKAAESIQKDWGGVLVYGDTDSNYINFPFLKTSMECWDHAIKVSKEVSSMYPKPMSLAFEEKIYAKFMILTKKRYMSLACERDGVVDTKISKKGVLLNRRDNCEFVRKVYSDVIMSIFNKKNVDDINTYLIDELNKLCSHYYPTKDFVITKSIGEVGELEPLEATDAKTNKPCWKIGDYKVKLLPKDEEERKKQFKLKNCDSAEDYYLRSLPAQVQLAEKMRNRGQLVAAGSRIEYVITTNGGHKAKQYEKVEDYAYFSKHSNSLSIDYLYYIHQLSNPIDQVLQIMYGQKDFILNQYKYRLSMRRLVLKEIESLFKPKLYFQ
jgi:DNA polymerase elongation subunit (family B)